MPILETMQELLSSNLDEMLSRSTDPEGTLKDYVMQLGRRIAELRHELGVASAARQSIADDSASVIQEMERWQERAQLALAQANEPLARHAVGRRQVLEGRYHLYTRELEALESGRQQLDAAIQAAQGKLAEAESRRDEILARQQPGWALARVRQSLGPMLSPTALTPTAQAVATLDARLGAPVDLSEAALEAQFQQLESGLETTSIDAELFALKAKMAQGGMG